jgi:hypothetical protein
MQAITMYRPTVMFENVLLGHIAEYAYPNVYIHMVFPYFLSSLLCAVPHYWQIIPFPAVMCNIRFWCLLCL